MLTDKTLFHKSLFMILLVCLEFLSLHGSYASQHWIFCEILKSETFTVKNKLAYISHPMVDTR